MSKEKLFTIGPKEFRVDTFRCGGKGGQNVNKRETGVRITHLASGAIGESREERQQEQNKKTAFRRLVDSPKFQLWIKMEAAARRLGFQDLEKRIDDMMSPRNLQITHLITFWCDAPGCRNFKKMEIPDDKLSELLPDGWIWVKKGMFACSQECVETLKNKTNQF